MFRPTHFVILFAVVLYANALPVAEAPIAISGQHMAVEPAGTLDLSKKEPGKADLETDATDYWSLYNYNRFARGGLYGHDIYGLRTYGWPSYYNARYYY